VATLFGEERNGRGAELRPAASLDCGDLAPADGSFLLVHNALDRLNQGDLLEITSTGAELDRELPGWLRLHGHTLLAVLDGHDAKHFLVRRELPGLHPLNPTLQPAEASHLGSGRDLPPWLRGRASVVPDAAETYLGFAPRGATVESGSPDYPFTLNRRDDVWADNLSTLHEQAKGQQWDAARDIAWGDLSPLPADLEGAVCQLMTFLAENEYAALYVPAKFLPRINARYAEALLFLAGVINDEARHIEAFTRRALANGGELGYASALTERSLLGLLVEEDYFRSSFLLHILGEGTFLDLLDFIATHAPDPVTADIVRRARLDEGRHVAYGIAHVRACLEARPQRSEELVAAAEQRAASLETTDNANGFVREALAVLAGGGSRPDQLRRGFQAVRGLDEEMHSYRVRRMQQIGLDRRTAEKISQIHTPNYM
jgi:TusA-related sulfurtransferase